MLLNDAAQIFNPKPVKFKTTDKEGEGFMVSFEEIDGRVYRGGFFPDKHAGEKLIKNELDAWVLAKRFAQLAPTRFVNIYVIKSDFTPVKDYASLKMRSR